MNLEYLISHIEPVNKEVKEKALNMFHNLAIPLNSLGKMQDMVLSLCAIEETVTPEIKKRAVVVFCADNGVVAQNISQVGCEVTTAVAKKLCVGETIMCEMAKFTETEVIPVDIGMKTPVIHPNIKQCAISLGTADFTKGVAMTREQAISAITVGMEIVAELKEKGYQLLITGEMGIGNTTTATAMTSVLLNLNPEDITGAGAGLSPEGISHKKKIIAQGIAVNNPNSEDILDVLSKVGGYDIAGMLGMILATAYYKIPCVIDGFISNVAAFCAISLCEHVKEYCIFSHETAEVGGQALLQKMNVSPMLCGNMRLGEGSGGVALLPLLDMGLSVFQQGITFSQMEIQAYEEK